MWEVRKKQMCTTHQSMCKLIYDMLNWWMQPCQLVVEEEKESFAQVDSFLSFLLPPACCPHPLSPSEQRMSQPLSCPSQLHLIPWDTPLLEPRPHDTRKLSNHTVATCFSPSPSQKLVPTTIHVSSEQAFGWFQSSAFNVSLFWHWNDLSQKSWPISDSEKTNAIALSNSLHFGVVCHTPIENCSNLYISTKPNVHSSIPQYSHLTLTFLVWSMVPYPLCM